MNKLLIFLSLILVSISFVSANGLQIEPSTLVINKTNGITYLFNLTITSEEPFKMFNITSENSIISFEEFDLNPGYSKTVEAKIIQNDAFSGDIRIRGDYFSQLGEQNIVENITIDTGGLDLCNLDLVEGDKIIWNNDLLSAVKLKNLDTGEYFATINAESSYEHLFDDSVEFNYQVFWAGLPFSNVCSLNIQSTEGYVHSRNLDAIVNLKLRIIYEPTTIGLTFLTTSYSLSYNQEKEDIFSITNNGNKIAKDIILSSEWITFSDNNFDLGIGESKNLGYTIRPALSKTEETNRSYNLEILVSGNFESQRQEIELFIKYADLDQILQGNTFDEEAIINLINFFCANNPDKCPKTYINGTEFGSNVTFTITEESYREKTLTDRQFQQEMLEVIKIHSEKLSMIENSSKIQINESKGIREEQERNNDEVASLSQVSILVIIIVLFGASLFLIFYIIGKERVRIKVRGLFKKGEKRI